MFKLFIAAIIAASILSACGGGSSSSTPSVAPVAPPVTAEGLWNGTASNGRAVSAIVLDDGNTWVLYTGQTNKLIAGALQGSGASNNGSFTTSNALDFNLEGNGVNAASVSASYKQKQSFNGSIAYANQTVSFTTTYSTDYDVAPSLATVAGSYAGPMAAKGGSELAAVTIDASGKVTAVGAGGCTSTGTIAPRAKGNVYNLSITVGTAHCATPGAIITGIGYFDAATKRLYATGLNSARTDGVIFTGLKS